MKRIVLIFILFFVFCSLFSVSFPAHADDLSEVETKLAELKRALSLSVAATTPLEKDLSKLKANLDEIIRRTKIVENDVFRKDLQVREGERLLLLAQELLSEKV